VQPGCARSAWNGPKLQRRRRANVAGGRAQTDYRHRAVASAGVEERLRKLAAEQNVTVARRLVESTFAEGGRPPRGDAP
jgi:hypothetical protein